jgi:hypothetical protein
LENVSFTSPKYELEPEHIRPHGAHLSVHPLAHIPPEQRKEVEKSLYLEMAKHEKGRERRGAQAVVVQKAA